MHKCHNPSSTMKLRGWTFLYFIVDYAFSVVASTPELFYLHYCMLVLQFSA
jgi:hypothetical protein